MVEVLKGMGMPVYKSNWSNLRSLRFITPICKVQKEQGRAFHADPERFRICETELMVMSCS